MLTLFYLDSIKQHFAADIIHSWSQPCVKIGSVMCRSNGKCFTINAILPSVNEALASQPASTIEAREGNQRQRRTCQPSQSASTIEARAGNQRQRGTCQPVF